MWVQAASARALFERIGLLRVTDQHFLSAKDAKDAKDAKKPGATGVAGTSMAVVPLKVLLLFFASFASFADELPLIQLRRQRPDSERASPQGPAALVADSACV